MRITSEHFGKKLRRQDWSKDGFFIPLGFSTNNKFVIGEHTSGVSDHWASFINDWELYEEPKKKVIKRLAPALLTDTTSKIETYFLSSGLYSSFDEAQMEWEEYAVKWPASENMFVEVEVEE